MISDIIGPNGQKAIRNLHVTTLIIGIRSGDSHSKSHRMFSSFAEKKNLVLK